MNRGHGVMAPGSLEGIALPGKPPAEAGPEGAAAPDQEGRVVILASTAWGLRNIVLSGVVERVRMQLPSVTVLAGTRSNSALAEGWSDTDAPVAELIPTSGSSGSLRQYLVSALAYASFGRRFGFSTYRIFGRWRRRMDGPWRRLRHQAVRLLAVVTSRNPFYGWLVRDLERSWLHSGDAAGVTEQLRRLRPTLVVSTGCVISDELPYVLAARQLGIPVLACILSFDNLTSKSVLPSFDDYAVWSARMRDEVLRLNPDQDPGRVYVTGTPQFDFHRCLEYRWSRERTLKDLALGPQERYILYAANCATYTPTEPALVAAFSDACSRVPGLEAHRIVVRPHPADDLRRWSDLPGIGGRILLRPARHPGTRFASADAQARLVSSLLHADVCVNMASTMTLDAATVDTPTVCIGFAHERGGLEDWLAAACYETEHFRPIAASGAAPVARSMEDLVAQTARYVKDRARDQEARARLVADVCGTTDGRAGERVADVIVKLAMVGAGGGAVGRTA